MIGPVVQIINGCVAGVLAVLHASVIVGQSIVSVAAAFLSGAASTCGFLARVYEDNRPLFTLELPSMVIGAPTAAINHFCDAAEALATVLSKTYVTIADFVAACFHIISWNITYSVATLNKIFTVIGDSMWLIITFIPVQLPALLGALIGWCWRATAESALAAYTSLLRLTNFLTDVPLQSLVGIVSTVIAVRLVVEFQSEILSGLTAAYRWSVGRVTLCYYYFYNYFMDNETRLIAQIVQGGGPRLVNANLLLADEQEAARGDALCVVCQERQKCVLILPCRHICLCRECCLRLYSYQRTCPICRTFICHSVNVYF